MSKLPVGTTGKILAGDKSGQFVKIVDDASNTGGFLILTANNPDFINGFDSWVEDESALQRYFRESGWLVEWIK